MSFHQSLPLFLKTTNKQSFQCNKQIFEVIKVSHFQQQLHWRYFVKKVLLKVSQNLQENICAGVFFQITLQTESLQIYFKKRLQRKCFLGNFATFLRTPILLNICTLLLLCFVSHFLGKFTFYVELMIYLFSFK